jgi:hypothetical protein
MKKFLFTACFLTGFFVSNAQTNPTDTTLTIIRENQSNDVPKKWDAIDLSNRSGDHFMVQFGFDKWSGTNDSVNPQGFSRHFNIYFMLDKPFRNNPKFSVGIGAGFGSSNMFFKRTNIDIKSASPRLPFTRLDSASHFKKYKLTTVFLEAPIELRYNSNPINSNKSFKMALGLKVGTLVNAHTKGKTLVDKNGSTINAYTMKESGKRYFSGTRLAATGRIGLGVVSLHGAYQITNLLKDGVGPEIRPYSIGLTLSGL